MGRWWAGWMIAVCCLAACDGDADDALRQTLQTQYAPRVRALVKQDIATHDTAVAEAAKRLAPGFAIDDLAKRERDMRLGLRFLQQPKNGIAAFVTSPMTYLAAVGADGIVVARDRQQDAMKGQDYGARFAGVKAALAGQAGHELIEFRAENPAVPSVFSMNFVAPAEHDGKLVGAVMAGIPLRRWAQRMQRQLRVEHADAVAAGASIWVYFSKGDRLFFWDTSPEVDAALPDAAARAQGLRAHPNGWLGEFHAMGAPFSFGFWALPEVAPDAGLLIVQNQR